MSTYVGIPVAAGARRRGNFTVEDGESSSNDWSGIFFDREIIVSGPCVLSVASRGYRWSFNVRGD